MTQIIKARNITVDIRKKTDTKRYQYKCRKRENILDNRPERFG